MSMIQRLKRLQIVWPAPTPRCATCASRPTVVRVEPDEPCPVSPSICPECGRAMRPAICLVAQPGAVLSLEEASGSSRTAA